MIHFKCPGCGLLLKHAITGDRVACPRCKQAIKVPPSAAEPVPPTESKVSLFQRMSNLKISSTWQYVIAVVFVGISLVPLAWVGRAEEMKGFFFCYSVPFLVIAGGFFIAAYAEDHANAMTNSIPDTLMDRFNRLGNPIGQQLLSVTAMLGEYQSWTKVSDSRVLIEWIQKGATWVSRISLVFENDVCVDVTHISNV
jgi:hypothetical protein